MHIYVGALRFGLVNKAQVRQIARNTAQKHKNLEKTKKNKKFDEVRP